MLNLQADVLFAMNKVGTALFRNKVFSIMSSLRDFIASRVFSFYHNIVPTGLA